jgi:hypothetical protein
MKKYLLNYLNTDMKINTSYTEPAKPLAQSAPPAPASITLRDLQPGNFFATLDLMVGAWVVNGFTTNSAGDNVIKVTKVSDTPRLWECRGTVGAPCGKQITLYRTSQKVVLLDPLTLQVPTPPAPPAPKFRKILGKDLKPGQIYSPSVSHTSVERVVSLDLKDDVTSSTLGRKDGRKGLTSPMCTVFAHQEVTLYPDARFEFGAPVTTITEGTEKRPLVKPVSEVRKGEAVDIGWGVAIATSDSLGRAFPGTLISAKPASACTAGSHYPLGLFACEDKVTVLDRTNLQPLTQEIASTRPVKVSDIKPGDVFSWQAEGRKEYHVFCTHIEDGTVRGLYLTPTGIEEWGCGEGLVASDPVYPDTTLQLYPEATLHLGRPVTEILENEPQYQDGAAAEEAA